MGFTFCTATKIHILDPNFPLFEFVQFFLDFLIQFFANVLYRRLLAFYNFASVNLDWIKKFAIRKFYFFDGF